MTLSRIATFFERALAGQPQSLGAFLSELENGAAMKAQNSEAFFEDELQLLREHPGLLFGICRAIDWLDSIPFTGHFGAGPLPFEPLAKKSNTHNQETPPVDPTSSS